MSPTLNPALVLLATRRDEIALALQRADEERIACAERHRMWVLECENLSAQLEAFDAAVGGLQAAEQSAAAVYASQIADELARTEIPLVFPPDAFATGTETTLAAPRSEISMVCPSLSIGAGIDGAVSLCSLPAGHAGDHIAMSGDRVLAQWGKGEERAMPVEVTVAISLSPCPSCGSTDPAQYLAPCSSPDEPVDPWHSVRVTAGGEQR